MVATSEPPPSSATGEPALPRVNTTHENLATRASSPVGRRRRRQPKRYWWVPLESGAENPLPPKFSRMLAWSLDSTLFSNRKPGRQLGTTMSKKRIREKTPNQQFISSQLVEYTSNCEVIIDTSLCGSNRPKKVQTRFDSLAGT